MLCPPARPSVYRRFFYSLVCPRILRASCMSFGMIVTRFAWTAHKLQSSNRPTRCASAASCNARIADACQLYAWRERPCWISLTNRAKGSRRMSKSVLFWYCRISCSARSPVGTEGKQNQTEPGDLSTGFWTTRRVFVLRNECTRGPFLAYRVSRESEQSLDRQFFSDFSETWSAWRHACKNQ